MKRSDVFPSTYLGKDDILKPTVVAIEAVRMETVVGDRGDSDKPALYFQGDTKRMILNSGNWDTLEDAYGDSDNWPGKRVEIYVDPNVMYGGKRVGGLRLRIPAGATKQSESKATQSPRPVVASWKEAVVAAAAVGISEDDLKVALKTRGFSKWSVDCSQAFADVLAFAAAKPTPPENGDDSTAPSGDDIPF